MAPRISAQCCVFLGSFHATSVAEVIALALRTSLTLVAFPSPSVLEIQNHRHRSRPDCGQPRFAALRYSESPGLGEPHQIDSVLFGDDGRGRVHGPGSRSTGSVFAAFL